MRKINVDKLRHTSIVISPPTSQKRRDGDGNNDDGKLSSCTLHLLKGQLQVENGAGVQWWGVRGAREVEEAEEEEEKAMRF